MNILFLPLDERPCNYMYPKELALLTNDLELITPDLSILGSKKKSANLEAILDFVEHNISKCDAFVFSIEMLFFGGLLPSRLHHYDSQHKINMMNRLKQLRSISTCKFYAFQLIMRCPRYNSNDEEPDYYEYYGQDLFYRSYLLDKKERLSLEQSELDALHSLNSHIPNEIIHDYELRRSYNIGLNLDILQLLKDGFIDYLSIPHDDSCEFGYTALDQKKVVHYISTNRLFNKVLMYPGADEAGCELISRAYNESINKVTKVYPFYSSYLGPTIVPLYEDRIMIESLKSHLLVSHCQIVENKDDADFILAINSPGKFMQEAFNQDLRDITYSSYRNLKFFVDTLKQDIDNGKKVVVADCAYANGGDLELISYLDEAKILDRLYAYRGWNTHCNTLGTTISQMVMCQSPNLNELELKKNLMVHILEDGFYQAAIRKKVTGQLPMELNYFDLKDQQKVVSAIVSKELLEMYHKEILHSFKNERISCLKITHPWNRMFEIGVELCLS